MNTKTAVRQKALQREEEQFAHCFHDHVESYVMMLFSSVPLLLCRTVKSEHDPKNEHYCRKSE